MANRLAQVIHKLLGESQIAFQMLRDIGENIDLMVESMRYVNVDRPERGGAIAILDNESAYDRVARHMHKACGHGPTACLAIT